MSFTEISYRIESLDIKSADTLKTITDTKSLTAETASVDTVVESKITVTKEEDKDVLVASLEEAVKTAPSGYYKIHECNHDSGQPCDPSTVIYVRWGEEVKPVAELVAIK